MTDDAARYAIYFAPDLDSDLARFGGRVLGRTADAIAADIDPHLLQRFPEWRNLVAPATRYGFHATLKAPFPLVRGVDQGRLLEQATALAADMAPIQLGYLKVSAIGAFAALISVAPPAELGAMADHVVRAFDPLRAPLSAADRARRQPETLTSRQVDYLDRWGYPYVFDEFRFHMTLTGPLPHRDRREVIEILADLYAAVAEPVVIDSLGVFAQSNRAAPFRLLHRAQLRGKIATG